MSPAPRLLIAVCFLSGRSGVNFNLFDFNRYNGTVTITCRRKQRWTHIHLRFLLTQTHICQCCGWVPCFSFFPPFWSPDFLVRSYFMRGRCTSSRSRFSKFTRSNDALEAFIALFSPDCYGIQKQTPNVCVDVNLCLQSKIKWMWKGFVSMGIFLGTWLVTFEYSTSSSEKHLEPPVPKPFYLDPQLMFSSPLMKFPFRSNFKIKDLDRDKIWVETKGKNYQGKSPLLECY